MQTRGDETSEPQLYCSFLPANSFMSTDASSGILHSLFLSLSLCCHRTVSYSTRAIAERERESGLERGDWLVEAVGEGEERSKASTEREGRPLYRLFHVARYHFKIKTLPKRIKYSRSLRHPPQPHITHAKRRASGTATAVQGWCCW